MRASAVIAFCAILLAGTPAAAGFSTAALDAISATPKPNAQLPLDLNFVDEHGAPRTLRQALGSRPAVLVFADYTCKTLCGPILSFAAAGLSKAGLQPGSDYHLIVIGIDPKDGLDRAREMKASRIGSGTPLAAATIMLTGKEPAIRAATAAAGYHYAYDPEHDQYAHPAAAFVVTPKGKIARVLSGIGLAGSDLRLALVDAGQGRIGTLIDQIHLLCYGFDPTKGIYTASIARWLEFGGVLTMLLLGGGLAFMVFAGRGGRPT